MGIDASAVARVTGIETQFVELLAGTARKLPQRIAVIAQGSSDVVYATDKIQMSSAFDAGTKFGFGSPIHRIMQRLFPRNGDGVGTIPVTIFPLVDDAAGVAAVGAIAPTGTQTEQAAYRVKVNNVPSEAFVLPKNVSVTDVCRLAGRAVQAVLEMPVKVTWTYGVLTSTPDAGNTGDGTVTGLTASGAPVPGDYTLECITAATNGGTFKLLDPDGTLIADDITVGSAADEGGLSFTVTDGTVDYAVGDKFTLTVPATDVQLTAKWKGESGNDLHVEVEGEDLGITFTVTQPTGGLVNPSVQPALDQVGDVWETMFLNALDIADTTALDALKTFGDGRWGALTRKPMVAFTGNTKVTVADATAVSSARTTDKVNAQLVAPGSHDLPFEVAARQLARIARVANNNPPKGYGGQRADGLTPGTDGEQWDYAKRDQAVKAGSSTSEVKSGQVAIGDVVTFYAPAGQPTPAFRHVVDIVKIQNIFFNLDLIFAADEWQDPPLVPNEQAVVEPTAKKPRDAVSAINASIDQLALGAIVADPKAAKKTTSAAIDGSNPKRLNWQTTMKIAGNAGIIDGLFRFGFHYGDAFVAA